jgi:hypothetical protein
MEIKVVRDAFTDKSTIGNVLIDEQFCCFCLEDVDRHLESDPRAKIPGRSAIPTGRYPIIRNLSNRFKKVLPLLVKVPGFEGIRIHVGNSPKDTEGCLLPGMTRKTDWVGDSKKAFDLLDGKIKAALDRKETVFITVERKTP